MESKYRHKLLYDYSIVRSTNIEGIADGHLIENECNEVRAGEHAAEHEVSAVK